MDDDYSDSFDAITASFSGVDERNEFEPGLGFHVAKDVFCQYAGAYFQAISYDVATGWYGGYVDVIHPDGTAGIDSSAFHARELEPADDAGRAHHDALPTEVRTYPARAA